MEVENNNYFKTRICIIHINYGVTAMSDVCSISAIRINKPLKEILQITKGMSCRLVDKQTF